MLGGDALRSERWVAKVRQGHQPGAEGEVREEPPTVRGFARKKQSDEELGFRIFIVYKNNALFVLFPSSQFRCRRKRVLHHCCGSQ